MCSVALRNDNIKHELESPARACHEAISREHTLSSKYRCSRASALRREAFTATYNETDKRPVPS